MKTEKKILKKIDEWSTNPLIVPAIYRLMTYIRWEAIPEKYKQFFSKEAAEKWNDDLDSFKEENIMLDIDAEIKAAFKGLFKRNIIQVLGIIPIILADIFVIDKPVARAQARLIKITKEYLKNYEIDKALAEAYAIIDLVEFLGYLQDLAKLKNKLNLTDLLAKIFETNNITSVEAIVNKGISNGISKEIDALVDKALLEYDEAQKKKGQATLNGTDEQTNL
jgi:hypothetical protein